eukprot:1692038-Pleurochrysis_carterae.AAC.1
MYKGWDNGVAVFEPHIYDDSGHGAPPIIREFMGYNSFEEWGKLGAVNWWSSQPVTRSFLQNYFDRFLFLFTVGAATYDQKLQMLTALLCIPPGINSMAILFK